MTSDIQSLSRIIPSISRRIPPRKIYLGYEFHVRGNERDSYKRYTDNSKIIVNSPKVLEEISVLFILS